MKKIKIAVVSLSSCVAMSGVNASEGGNSALKDMSLDVLLRNTYYNRDFKDKRDDAKVWGQAFIANFDSGFTPGFIGVGVEAYGLLGIKLDSGRGRNYEAFFDTDSRGRPVDSLSEAGATLKFKVSETVVAHGNQFPVIPVLAYDDTRLLPESFTGTLITSEEFDSIVIHAGRFTADSPMGDSARDPNRMKSINVAGGVYSISDNTSVAYYYSDLEDQYRKSYGNINYALPLDYKQSLAIDYNIYRTDYVDGAQSAQDFGGDGSDDQNTLWSLSIKYDSNGHSLMLAHQRNYGSAGYAYDYGDGGSTLYVANSYYADFNLKDEESWQLAYEVNFEQYGVPGLSYKTAYVRGSNIDLGNGSEGNEREFFNQVSYVTQNGALKGLSLRLRNSIYRASNDVGADLNETRVFIEYPLSIL